MFDACKKVYIFAAILEKNIAETQNFILRKHF